MNQLLRGSGGNGTRRSVGVSRETVPRSQSDSAAIQNTGDVPSVFLPFLQKTFLPFDYFNPAEKKIYLHHISKEHVFYWKNRYAEEISTIVIPEVTTSEMESIYKWTFDTKKLFSDSIRFKINARFLHYCKEMYPEEAKNFTRFKQVYNFVNMEIAAGRSEKAYKIKYERWPASWENEMEDELCRENSLVFRGWIDKSGQYKGSFAKIASSVMGQQRRKIHDIIRRQKAVVVDGVKVRRRNKHSEKFNPDIHIRNSPKKIPNNNGKRQM